MNVPTAAFARRLPNLFDLAAGLCILAALITLADVARGTLAPMDVSDAAAISLDPWALPGYAGRTTLRMFAALLCSLVFTFVVATVAAKSRHGGLVLLPVLDVLQAVPILGFLSFTVVFFTGLFPGQVLGAELASIFAIFTSQAWNMTFSLHQSLTTVPADLAEAARSYRLSPWQRFWRLEVPFAMPGLVWNMVMSMSGGWFFVVASEAVTVGSESWKLPGIGSYVATALEQRDLGAVLWAIGAMLAVIVAYDQLLFRPLVAWSAKFRFEQAVGDEPEDPWMLRLLRRTRLLRRATDALGRGFGVLAGLRLAGPARAAAAPGRSSRTADALFGLALVAALVAAAWQVTAFAAASLTPADVGEAVLLGGYTLTRVVVLMAAATLLWVPVGVWIGLRPRWSQRVMALAQFLAAFPANLFFPVFVVLIVRTGANPEIWLSPLMMLGAQWYILFNVIAGASVFPGALQEVARSFRVGGWLWWRRVVLPGVFPYYVTGAIAASGGAWNASIVAEVAAWGDQRLVAHGLGAYIAEATAAGRTARVVLGVAVMCLFVAALNRLVWRPLQAFSSRRLTLG